MRKFRPLGPDLFGIGDLLGLNSPRQVLAALIGGGPTPDAVEEGGDGEQRYHLNGAAEDSATV